MHDTILRAWPDEATTLQALVVKTQSLTVPPQHLDPIAAPATKHKQLTRERIVALRGYRGAVRWRFWRAKALARMMLLPFK